MPEKRVIRIGDVAPDLAFLTLDGQEWRLSDYRGKRVLLFFWASWCPCREQLAAWEEFHQKHRGDPFEFIAVAMDAAGSDTVRAFAKQAAVTYPITVDGVDCLWDQLGFNHIPNGYYVDERGIVRYLKIGGFDIRETLNAKIVEDLLSEKWSKKPLRLPDKTKMSFKQEIAVLSQQLKSVSRGVEKRLRLADFLAKTGQFRKAGREYDSVLTQQPKNTRALFARGVAYFHEGKKEQTKLCWRRAFALEPTNWIIRKQIWALDAPERFYPRIQYDWQNEQVRREEIQALEEQKFKLKVKAQKK
jgi:peroxiredoxin